MLAVAVVGLVAAASRGTMLAKLVERQDRVVLSTAGFAADEDDGDELERRAQHARA